MASLFLQSVCPACLFAVVARSIVSMYPICLHPGALAFAHWYQYRATSNHVTNRLWVSARRKQKSERWPCDELIL
ncbi:hypothetical protein BKA67DRAFT_551369 [Truncatella angustata]|uniref:Secreted protein n=1 Tax=Truncatella angustata TaxID=152316 RepID=A0A9P8UQ19_9PEZI|nr:uncharacterized protein BKA67DRAFT_551369 [Truncatella angustata]KAH6656248.1 hypothetical protein BKA67DRAFT_551369 [Truncatella angustata]